MLSDLKICPESVVEHSILIRVQIGQVRHVWRNVRTGMRHDVPLHGVPQEVYVEASTGREFVTNLRVKLAEIVSECDGDIVPSGADAQWALYDDTDSHGPGRQRFGQRLVDLGVKMEDQEEIEKYAVWENQIDYEDRLFVRLSI